MRDGREGNKKGREERGRDGWTGRTWEGMRREGRLHFTG